MTRFFGKKIEKHSRSNGHFPFPGATLKVLLSALFTLYTLAGLYAVYWLGVVKDTPFGQDFQIYYDAWNDITGGGNPYDPYDVGSSFLYHPASFFVIGPFAALLPAGTARITWIVFNALIWVVCIALALRLIITHSTVPPRDPIMLLGGALMLSFGPLLENLYVGQINPLVTLSLLITLWALHTQRDRVAGLSLAVAIILKTSPLIFVVWLLALRRFRAVVSVTVSLVVFSLAAMLLFSPDIMTQFVEASLYVSLEIHPTLYNQSSLAAVYRIVEGTEVASPLSWLSGAHKLIFVATVAVIALTTAARARDNPRLQFATFSALLVVMFFFSPLVWYHHATVLVLPLLALLAAPEWRIAAGGAITVAAIQSTRAAGQIGIESGFPALTYTLILALIFVWLSTMILNDTPEAHLIQNLPTRENVR